MMLMVKSFLARSRKTSKVDDFVQLFQRPYNMPFLKSPRIDKEVFRYLAQPARTVDKGYRTLQVFLNELNPLISQAGVQAKQALQIIAYTNREINNRRIDSLKPVVLPQYLPLFNSDVQPSEDWFLSGTLNDSLKQCDDSRKVSDQIRKVRNYQGQQVFNQNVDHSENSYNNNNQVRQRYRGKGKKKDFKYQNSGGYSKDRQSYQSQVPV